MSLKTVTLMTTAENMSQEELMLAPELPSLVALDASLLAATTLLEFHNPSSGFLRSGNRETINGVEEQIAESICILADALRANLSAYYKVIRQSCGDSQDQQEVSF